MEELFKAKLREDRTFENRLGTALSHRQYNVLVSKILGAKLNKSHKLASEQQLMEKYEVIEEETKRLIVRDSNPRIYYVHDDELFPILLKAHMATDHGNRNQMMNHLSKTYKNIPYQDVLLFLSLCQECAQNKLPLSEKDKRMAKFNKVCLVEIIDFHFSPDGDYKFVFVYKEMFTKFIMLKPLKSSKPEEVADHLINIFGILAPPERLQSSCGPKFVANVIDILKILWPSLNITGMKMKGAKNSSAQEIENMITTWMRYNNKSRWTEGIRFVQLKHNTTLHNDIFTTPYEALFRHSVKVGTGERVDEEHAEERQPREEDNEVGLDVKEEIMDICKTELRNVCGTCGNEMEDEEKCNFCIGKPSDEAMSFE